MKRNGFGDRLKALLKQKGLTQAQVAKAVNTSVPSVSRWTKGGEIEYDNLRVLADYLDVNWIWLRYGDEAIASLKDSMPDNNPMTDMRREYLDEIMANEARMKSALEMAEIVNWEWNVLTGTVTLSPNAETVFGVEEQALPNCMLPFVHTPIEKLKKTFGQEQPYSWDFTVTGDDGSEKWFTSRAKLTFDAANRPTKVIGVSTDITARKNAETALEKSEYMMRKIVELIPVGLWAADETGNICLANSEVKRIWGGAKYVGLEQYGEYKGWWDKSGEEVGAEGWTLARAVKKGETSRPEVVNIEAFDGMRRTITMYSTPLYDLEQNIIGAIEINQDITELKEIERTLKSSLDEWKVIFEQNLFGAVEISNGRISKVNRVLIDTFKLNLKNIEFDDIFEDQTSSDISNELSKKKITPQTIKGNLRAGKITTDIYLLPKRQSEDITRCLLMFALG
jgi:PAS domain S-box-containing protein